MCRVEYENLTLLHLRLCHLVNHPKQQRLLLLKLTCSKPSERVAIISGFVAFGVPAVGAADTEIKVPSVENTELKGSPFKV